MKTFHIHIKGQVQGVGFRPYVYKMATDMNLNGTVSNTADGVHIHLNGTNQIAHKFYKEVIEKVPPLAIVTKHSMKEVAEYKYYDFSILRSDNGQQPDLLLTPDYGICEDCQEDIFSDLNKRFSYAFTTCTNCGPRYSIIKKLPYDRENTTMDTLEMCSECFNEYHNPLNRRYYSQTNSCPDCAVRLFIVGKEKLTDQQKILELIKENLKAGKIVALKGIGGYLLMADATNEVTIKLLRERKHRPVKPFALMYSSMEQLEEDVVISEQEKEKFRNVESPILLLQLKEHPKSGICLKQIAPGLKQVGAMQPYTPLFMLLLKDLGFPVIATSANVSESPIIYKDEKAEQCLVEIADLIVGNDRPILIPQDDSVLRFSPKFNQQIFIRRSRGYAPNFLGYIPNKNPGETVLAMGAGLKSSFAFYHLNNCYVSQYLGRLLSFDSQETYKRVVEHYFDVFKTVPGTIITDTHPNYFSTEYGQELAVELDVSVKKVQHHKAHFAAILGENELLDSKEQVLGVIWDGVGLGDDQNIWGGEFFVWRRNKMERVAHFDYFTHLAFDKFAMEPRLPALSLLYQSVEIDFVKNKFNEHEWSNYLRLLNKDESLLTSSVGRLFDAVASLIGITDKNTFEGEAAMLLENIALECKKKLTRHDHYLPTTINLDKLSGKEIVENIVLDLKSGTDASFVALKFHYTLVLMIGQVAKMLNIKKLAFSGGVFQNALLVDLIVEYLKKDYELYFHKQLSPNDENISYGQLIYNLGKISLK